MICRVLPLAVPEAGPDALLEELDELDPEEPSSGYSMSCDSRKRQGTGVGVGPDELDDEPDEVDDAELDEELDRRELDEELDELDELDDDEDGGQHETYRYSRT